MLNDLVLAERPGAELVDRVGRASSTGGGGTVQAEGGQDFDVQVAAHGLIVWDGKVDVVPHKLRVGGGNGWELVADGLAHAAPAGVEEDDDGGGGRRRGGG